jgi:16S rRNA (guanine(527)-N(7))-methyltransferase RsmG
VKRGDQGLMFHVEHFIDTFLPKLNKDLLVKKLEFIEQEYFKWNKHINISSLRDKDGFWIRHVLDSLCLVHYFYEKKEDGDIFDIGSGGGFPGLILATALSNNISMFEPVIKKTDFTKHCILRLSLNNAKVFNERYQDIKKLSKNVLVVSRALGNYKEMCEHFFNIEPELKIVLMSTKTDLDKLKGLKLEVFDKSYDFINNHLKNTFKNNILVQINK